MIRLSGVCLMLMFLFSCTGASPDQERKIIERYIESRWENGNPNVMIELFDRERNEYRRKVFDPDSILVHSKEFRADTLHGRLVRYYRSGPKMVETEFVLGKRHGLSRGWFESGKEKFKNLFQNDTLIYTESFYENGQKEADLNLKNGQLDSVAIYYTPEGSIKMKGQWKQNLKTGVWDIYGEDSSLQYRAHYHDGTLEKIDTLTVFEVDNL